MRVSGTAAVIVGVVALAGCGDSARSVDDQPRVAPTSTASIPSPNDPEAAIRAAFGSWINAKTPDAASEYVEDHAAIVQTLWRAYNHLTDVDRAHSGHVDAVRLLDATHASVQYTISNRGRSYQQAGQAIRVGGVWRISRETVCDLTVATGFTCPTRDTGRRPVIGAACTHYPVFAVYHSYSGVADPAGRNLDVLASRRS